MAKLQGIRRDLDDAGRTSQEIGAKVARIEESRPTLEAALGDLANLRGAHAEVTGALEQTQLAHREITRMRESQSETRTWLAGVEQSFGELSNQVGELKAMAPTIEFVQKQTQRIGESMSEIESRREFVESLHRRLTDLESLNGQLDERGRELQARMEAAERQFAGLVAHAEEAERMTMTVASVSSELNRARRQSDEVKKAVATIMSRAESVEELAQQTRVLREEIVQQQHALAETAKQLEQTSAVRQETATSAQQLDETVQQLTAALAKADQRVQRNDQMSRTLEDRAAQLQGVKQRLDQFEERLAAWASVDESVSRSLEEIASRQDSVGSLQADLGRMFAMAEKTATDVREITSSHREIEESRELLKDVTERLQEVRDMESAIDERKRQMVKAEERLARAEGLLVDVGSTLEALQGQKAIVDQAVEKAGSLQFLVKQAEASIEGLREERKTTDFVRSAVARARQDNDEDDAEDAARAA
jgi:chromosome segregation ATPase